MFQVEYNYFNLQHFPYPLQWHDHKETWKVEDHCHCDIWDIILTRIIIHKVLRVVGKRCGAWGGTKGYYGPFSELWIAYRMLIKEMLKLKRYSRIKKRWTQRGNILIQQFEIKSTKRHIACGIGKRGTGTNICRHH